MKKWIVFIGLLVLSLSVFAVLCARLLDAVLYPQDLGFLHRAAAFITNWAVLWMFICSALFAKYKRPY